MWKVKSSSTAVTNLKGKKTGKYNIFTTAMMKKKWNTNTHYRFRRNIDIGFVKTDEFSTFQYVKKYFSII